MTCVPGADFWQMQAMQPVGKNRIVRRQKDQAMRLRPQRLAQRVTPFCIARAHDHQAAFGQGAGRGNRIGRPLVVGHKREQTRVEAGGGSC